ncbi:ATP-binding cassette domain-containing protein [Lysinibacter cavernae]|uniref:ABC-2 type transport system ATP-binding protein n=1 Tax=Lysinibacter cavernae TaxID=1640652 RepID=A0A7X5R0Y8_9MICO|nr:ATP-binding cassette domain-containing protein [Lysinibacter cavernae]NIH53628.1 ABC-2 type transport system ATP-binding protein [Lysinibacter cavernae]
MTGFAVSATNLGITYGRSHSATIGLAEATVRFEANGIHGLIGAANTGKSSLLSLIAGHRLPTTGGVTVDGEAPFENARLTPRTYLVRKQGDLLLDQRLSTNVRLHTSLRQGFDQHYAYQLLNDFEIDPSQKMMRIPLAKRRLAAALLGLASRAPLTMFDDVVETMTTPVRKQFYDELLRDTVGTPRTFILAGSSIDESERMLTSVTLLRNNRVLLSEETARIRTIGTSIRGPRLAVAEIENRFAQSRVLSKTIVGESAEVHILGEIDLETGMRASQLNLERQPLPLEELVTYLADRRVQLPPSGPGTPARGADPTTTEPTRGADAAAAKETNE